MQRRRAIGLDADDPRLRPKRLHRGGQAGDQTAATDRDEDDVDIGDLVEDVEAERTLAGDHHGIAERMGIGRAGFPGIGERRGIGIVPDRADDLDLGAPCRQLGDLVGDDIGRQEDLGPGAEHMGRAGDGEPVIAA